MKLYCPTCFRVTPHKGNKARNYCRLCGLHSSEIDPTLICPSCLGPIRRKGNICILCHTTVCDCNAIATNKISGVMQCKGCAILESHNGHQLSPVMDIAENGRDTVSVWYPTIGKYRLAL